MIGYTVNSKVRCKVVNKTRRKTMAYLYDANSAHPYDPNAKSPKFKLVP
jgi:hypothetical protein